jgi:hypothetical protein
METIKPSPAMLTSPHLIINKWMMIRSKDKVSGGLAK